MAAAKKTSARTSRPKKARHDRVATWVLLGGGIVLVTGVGLLTYALTRPGQPPPQPQAASPPPNVAAAHASASPSTGARSAAPVATPESPPTPKPPSVPLSETHIPDVPVEPSQPEKSAPESAPAQAPPSLLRGFARSESAADPELVAARKPGGPAAATAKELFFFYPDQAVNRAIDRGVAYLRQAEDFRTGAKALAGLTLLSCGVPERDPAVAHLVAAVRADAPRLSATYELSLCVFFLDRLGRKQDEELIRRIALQLIAGQGPHGGWNYHSFPLSAGQEKKLLALLQAPVKPAPEGQPFALRQPTEWQSPQMRMGMVHPADLRNLPAMQFRPGQRIPFEMERWHEDNSLTQFASLALWTAARHGIPVRRSLAMVESRFRVSQNPDGSWNYKWGAGPKGMMSRFDSMTCAGLLGLALGEGVQPTDEVASVASAKKPPPPRNLRPAIEAGLQFLAQRIGAAPLPPQVAAEQMKANARKLELQKQLRQADLAQRMVLLQQLKQLIAAGHAPHARGTILGANAHGDLYFLWSLERVGMIYDLRTIGGKDWYAWGAPLIVAAQQPDGSWSDLFPGVPDTCFALLFLHRTNVAPDLTESLQHLILAPHAATRSNPMADSSSDRPQTATPKQ